MYLKIAWRGVQYKESNKIAVLDWIFEVLFIMLSGMSKR